MTLDAGLTSAADRLTKLQEEIATLAEGLRSAHPATAELLDSLKEAIDPDGDPSGWSGVNVYELLDPSGIAQDERNRLLRDKGLAARERFRNLLALLPVPLTWFGLMYAAIGYNTAIAAQPNLITQPFLLLWERGFEGLVPAPWGLFNFLTFSHVAIVDVGILLLVLVLTWQLHSVINVLQSEREHRGSELEYQLRKVAGAATLIFARRTSPRATDDRSRRALEALLDELRAERERGAQLASQREREAADLRTFGSEFRVGAQDLKRVSGELQTAFDGMLSVVSSLDDRINELARNERSIDNSLAKLATGFEQFEQLEQTSTLAMTATAKQLSDAADRAVSSSASIAEGLDRLGRRVDELGEQNRRAASSQEEASRLLGNALEASKRSVEQLQNAAEEMGYVLQSLGDVAPRMQDAALKQAASVEGLGERVQQFLGESSALVAGVTQAIQDFGATTDQVSEAVVSLSEQLVAAGVAKRRSPRRRRIPWIIPTPWRKQQTNGAHEDEKLAGTTS